MRTAAQPVRMAPKARSKYRAVKVTIDGITFASKAEAQRYGELKLLVKAGKIHQLAMQHRIRLQVLTPSTPQGHVFRTIGEYVADFAYCTCSTPTDCKGINGVVEDVKGFRTPLYRWKKKHVEAQYGIVVREIR